MLTVRSGERSSWTSSSVISHSRCRSGTGMTPCAGCGPGTSCAARVLTRSWPAGPAGCDLVMGHFPHRSCEQNTSRRSHVSARRGVSVPASRWRCPRCVDGSVREPLAGMFLLYASRTPHFDTTCTPEASFLTTPAQASFSLNSSQLSTAPVAASTNTQQLSTVTRLRSRRSVCTSQGLQCAKPHSTPHKHNRDQRSCDVPPSCSSALSPSTLGANL